jgi:hypothetical protein
MPVYTWIATPLTYVAITACPPSQRVDPALPATVFLVLSALACETKLEFRATIPTVMWTRGSIYCLLTASACSCLRMREGTVAGVAEGSSPSPSLAAARAFSACPAAR